MYEGWDIAFGLKINSVGPRNKVEEVTRTLAQIVKSLW